MARYNTCLQIRPILPERRHLTLLETLAKHHDALGGEGATALKVHNAELDSIQAAKDTNYERFQKCDIAPYHTWLCIGALSKVSPIGRQEKGKEMV